MVFTQTKSFWKYLWRSSVPLKHEAKERAPFALNTSGEVIWKGILWNQPHPETWRAGNSTCHLCPKWSWALPYAAASSSSPRAAPEIHSQGRTDPALGFSKADGQIQKVGFLSCSHLPWLLETWQTSHCSWGLASQGETAVLGETLKACDRALLPATWDRLPSGGPESEPGTK